MSSQPTGEPLSLRALKVRLLRGTERTRFRQLMEENHYLGYEHIVGKSLCYVGTHGSEWVALLGWGSAALKCGVRDRWIGWERSLQWRRLHLIANNVRFLILPGCNQPNVASRLLALNLKRLSRDWEFYHGHPILLAETFVASARFRATCYRAAGFEVLGQTRGFAKRNRHYWHHGQPKLVLVRPLVFDARERLIAPFLPPLSSSRKEPLMIDVNSLPLEGEGGLMDLLKTLTEKRQENPNVDLLIGAVNVWCWEPDALSIVRDAVAAAAAGMDRYRDRVRQVHSALLPLVHLCLS